MLTALTGDLLPVGCQAGRKMLGQPAQVTAAQQVHCAAGRSGGQVFGLVDCRSRWVTGRGSCARCAHLPALGGTVVWRAMLQEPVASLLACSSLNDTLSATSNNSYAYVTLPRCAALLC